MILLCAITCALAVATGIPLPPQFRLEPIPMAPNDSRRPPWQVISGLSAGLLVLPWAGPILAVAAGAPVGVIVWLVLTQQRKHLAERRAEVARACSALASLLQMGHIPNAALQVVADDEPVLAQAAATVQIGGEAYEAMARTAKTPGYETLAEISEAWQIAQRTGASLSMILDAVSQRLNAEAKVRAVIDAELSSTRATGKLLAALPVVGLALGYAVGGDPWVFLTESTAGQVVLASGVILAAIGLVWVEKVANVRS